MSCDLSRLRRAKQRQAALAETHNDTEAIIHICVPYPRKVSRKLIIASVVHDVEDVAYEYKDETCARPRPPADEIARAIAENRYIPQGESYYSRFYNDNQVTPRVATTTRPIFLASEATMGAASTVEARTHKIGSMQRSNLRMTRTHDDRERVFPNTRESSPDLVIHETYPGEYLATLAMQRARYAKQHHSRDVHDAECDRLRPTKPTK